MGFRYIIVILRARNWCECTGTHILLSHLFQSKGAERKHRNDAKQIQKLSQQEKVVTLQQPIRANYLGHVSSYQPIRDQYFME